eukprot:6185157-Pleurochrysis_carterae.AAC.3
MSITTSRLERERAFTKSKMKQVAFSLRSGDCTASCAASSRGTYASAGNELGSLAARLHHHCTIRVTAFQGTPEYRFALTPRRIKQSDIAARSAADPPLAQAARSPTQILKGRFT